MAAAWRAILKLFGVGGRKEETPQKEPQPARYHPYDEITDEQLNENRRRPPRSHPYDEISDDQLKQNKPSPASFPKQPRSHPYDEVLDPEPEDSTSPGHRPKMRIASEENGTRSPPSSTPELHYVEVEIQPGAGAVGARRVREPQEPTIYSEVRPTSPTT